MSDSVQPHRWQPTKAPPSLGFSRQEHWSGLPFPFPVHESESGVAQSCRTLSKPMDCSLPGSSIHGIFQARVLKWVAIAFSDICPLSSVTQSCPTLCDPMNRSMPGLPVHHQLPESTQTHVHQVGDAIQASHLLLSPSPPALNLSRIRVFSNESDLHIRWPSIGVSASTSVLPMNTQD